MTRTKIHVEAARAARILVHRMLAAVGENRQPPTGTGRGTDLNAGKKIVARNGAAGAPGETATEIAITSGWATLGEAVMIGNGPAEIGEIKIGIEGGGKIRTGTVAVMLPGAGERALNYLRISCMAQRNIRCTVAGGLSIQLRFPGFDAATLVVPG
jgi:hypothetical protein